ncbi:tRNA nucleotidyltransferase (CCA-adding enzyme) [Trichlorobacter thiogenes]|uniref:tRNA nucleotidyltransferase (CCA-adding enzyme) n=1 Tax=Trichlorobacter thiogenes TaxID=115783 RepID=A0A1T4LS51_9BACT|nr:CBS domain-containing protein [Trichlorobacter thiogenes]SJZ57477.1 tRNA nucleotidyltransferase (CCA-adding enzyme) [Trichlorobacter thiogenes]
MDLVISHLNADFDCLGSLAAAGRLYPGALLSFPGSQEKNLRDFSARHPDLLPSLVRSKDIDLSSITRLIIVDCQQPSRIGRFAELLERPGLTLHLYDHHPATVDSITASDGIVRPVGATSTIMTELLRERGIEPTPAEATLLLLGIHEDTGRLLFPTTTPEDYRAAAWLLERGARLHLADEILSPELTTPQVELLHDLLSTLKTSEVSGVRISVAHASRPWYVGDIAGLAHMMRDMENLDLLVLVVAMADRIYLVARSRVPEVDVGELLRLFGGGGHASAASATVKGEPLSVVLERLERNLLLIVHPRKTVGQIMSSPVRSLPAETTVLGARDLLVRYNYSAMPVLQGEQLLGIITRKVAEKTVYHGLGDRPVTEVMHTAVMHATPDTPLTTVMDHMVGGDRRFVPVFDGDQLVGVVTRTDLLRHLHGSSRDGETLYDLERLSPEPKQRDLATLLRRRLPADSVQLLELLGNSGDEQGVAVHAVGGFVRDLLLDLPNLDLDITIEGDGIFFAETFGEQHGCRVRPHQAFGTAVVVFPDGRKLDVASTRLEYYDSPGVLPTVERASLRHDLYRRDFTINTLALCLNHDRFGVLLDFFGGQKDLQDKTVRVLHNLSFVEDPTRAFRAIRFEQRLSFQLDPHTEGLLRSAVRAGLVERVGGKRLMGELIQILKEQEPTLAVKRMAQLGLLPCIHTGLRFGPDSEQLFAELERVLAWYQLLYLETPLEPWTVWFLALMDRLDSPQYLEVCQRLMMPERLMERIFGHRHKALKRLQHLRQALGRGQEISNSQLYTLLHGMPLELLLYGLARSGQDELRRLVSHYLTRLAEVKSLVSGTELQDLGVPRGPAIRTMKERLLSARLDGLIASKDEELELARQLIVEQL